ncbi:MAG: hypothetical protein DRP09_13880 [Candidatus Thorarchaeota archaeon]|nr:MAG: hypothetical protein DRP09_13880 [Candidatus Thorarchaeota archaeon]
MKVTGEQESTRRYDEVEGDSMGWGRSDDVREGIHMLLSHHPPSMYGHCLRVTVRGRSVYFCARCSGIYGGLGLGLLFLFLFRITLEPDWLWFLFAIGTGFATVVDWMSQRLTPRKTTNLVRASTGLMSGIALAIVFYLGNLFFMLITLVIMSASIGITSLIEGRRRNAYYESVQDEMEREREEETS